jgi:hypothetical protein
MSVSSSESSTGSNSDDFSDDEYLTSSAQNGNGADPNQEREAIIRKKLLESFYGKSQSGDGGQKHGKNRGKKDSAERRGNQKNSSEGVKDDVDLDGADDTNEDSRDVHHVGSVNLDSTHFVAVQYTKNTIDYSSFESLLSETEKLATEIRGLDSTMQTLVYENYSKFIDATEAIRSIGRSVGASDSGLRRLASSIQNIEQETLSVDTALAESREAVVEKLRIKRHLDRLDALLKLPDTLRMQILSGNYRTAAKSYTSASPILAKHSGAFESLAQIESECNSIMRQMKSDLQRKLACWTKPSNRDVIENISQSSEFEVAVLDSKHISDVFECAGTLHFLSLPSAQVPHLSDDEGVDGAHISDSQNEAYDRLALSSCSLLLLRSLERHGEKQESRAELSSREKVASLDAGNSDVIPENFLDYMLHAAAMFGTTFPSLTQSESQRRHSLLSCFVGQTFARFLYHARTVLEAKFAACIYQDEVHGADIDSIGSKRETRLPTFKTKTGLSHSDQVTADLAYLVKAAREMASGMTLPEVGLEVELAGLMVDQTLEMCDGLIKQHIASHFNHLRSRVLSKCIIPFVVKVANLFEPETIGDEKDSTPFNGLALIGQAMMNEAMETTDTVIAGLVAALCPGPREKSTVQRLVQEETQAFSRWFMTILKVVAGCEDCAGGALLRVLTGQSKGVESGGMDQAQGKKRERALSSCFVPDPEISSILSLVHRLDNAPCSDGAAHTAALGTSMLANNLPLAVGIACQEAQDHFSGKMIQAVVSVSNDTIPGLEEFAIAIDEDLRRVANDCLSTFIVDVGDYAVSKVARDFQEGQSSVEEESLAPGPYIIELLKLKKDSCLELAKVFGFSTNFPPIVIVSTNNVMQLQAYSASGYRANASGLQMDVERMFAEKVAIHTAVDFHQDSVASLTLRIALKGVIECARASFYTAYGYQQIQIDAELVRHVAPHFVSESDTLVIACLLDDLLCTTASRCSDIDPLENSEVTRSLSQWWETSPLERCKIVVEE